MIKYSMENQRLLRRYWLPEFTSSQRGLNRTDQTEPALLVAHLVVEFAFVWYVGTYVNNIGLLGNLKQLFKDKKHK